MRLVLASNNQHKVDEFRDCLGSFTLLTPGELGIAFDHDETALSFHGNALGKALALYQALAEKGPLPSDLAILADDSGICVDALEGAPGIYSARYGSEHGKNLSSQDRNRLLLKNLEGVDNRTAHFVCALALVWDQERFSVVQETWDGSITETLGTGINGFGYDPIFWLPDYQCTVAELEPVAKSHLSHRGKAAKALTHIIKHYEE